MAAPEQFFGSGHPPLAEAVARGVASLRMLTDVASRIPAPAPAETAAAVAALASAASAVLPRIEPADTAASMLALASVVSAVLPPTTELADFAPAPAHVPLSRVTLVPPGGMTMEACSTRDASRRDGLKRNAAAVAFAWLYLAVPAEAADRLAAWAGVVALLVILHSPDK